MAKISLEDSDIQSKIFIKGNPTGDITAKRSSIVTGTFIDAPSDPQSGGARRWWLAAAVAGIVTIVGLLADMLSIASWF